METADRMKKINVIRRSKESWKTIHIMRLLPRVIRQDKTLVLTVARTVHVAIRALSSVYTVGIVCSSKVI
jgi:hypothetical protein